MIIVLDFGAQYSQLIARRVREQKVYCEILPFNTPLDNIRAKNPSGIILSGGPASVYQNNAPRIDRQLFHLGIPILGICYGLQLGVLELGGKVTHATQREYGRAICSILNKKDFFFGLPDEITVWMSHGDYVENINNKFEVLARTSNTPFAALRAKNIPFYGVQFHPEVIHTPLGSKIIHNFLYRICKVQGDWKMKSFISETVEKIKNSVGNKKVLCALSGGVDSSVVAALIHKAIGKNLTCIFVDNGLLRKSEAKYVLKTFKNNLSLNIKFVNAAERFIEKLKGISNPEKKREIIGREFIKVFREAARKLGKFDYLAQGTLYPDVIESISAWGGPTAKIKSHHNVGGLPKRLKFKLIEPLRALFKDEVRLIGKELGLPDKILLRQPFPGPGLGVRVVGLITAERLEILRNADVIVTEEIEKNNLQKNLWQYFAVLLPVSSVGVMGDERSYEYTIALRIVESIDGMTADWSRIPYNVISQISSRITNEVKGINRVVFDITSKPPSTIEWE
jgi:GMP synthase (glutamine-hydrolysing)